VCSALVWKESVLIDVGRLGQRGEHQVAGQGDVDVVVDAGSTVFALGRSSRVHSQPQPKVAMSTGDRKCDEKVAGEHCRSEAIYAFQSTASRMRLPRSWA